MPGAIAKNYHEGTRSEYLAQYVFTAWGTVVAAPHQEDYGLDLYCTLVEPVGQRAWAKSTYTVQVKSNMEPWVFDGVESVRWLIEHPLSVFLCVVDKNEGRLRVYHTAPRFYVWSLGLLPARLTLRPTTDLLGHCTQWESSLDFSLSAPILDISLADLLNDGFMKKAKRVLELWIDVDSHNLGLLRAGLMRFRMPNEYRSNDPGVLALYEQGITAPSDEQMKNSIVHLAEALDCVGGQFFYRSDIPTAVRAALLCRHLAKMYPHLVGDQDSGGALTPLYDYLNQRMGQKGYLFGGLDAIDKVLCEVVPSDRNEPRQ